LPDLPTRAAGRSQGRWVRWALLLSFTAIALSSTSPTFADTPPKKPLGPGDPLPPIHLDYGGTIETEIGEGAVARVVASGGAQLTFGDLHIHADRIVFSQDGLFIQAAGHVTVVRGDERFSGDELTFAGAARTFDLKNGVAISPPFYLSGARITRDDQKGLIASKARFVPSPDGNGEIALSAEKIQITADGKSATLRNATLSIGHSRLLTIRYVRIPLASALSGNGSEVVQPRLQSPIVLRYSGVAGTVIGLTTPVEAPFGIYGSATAAYTTRTQPQFHLDLRRNLIASEAIGRARPSSVFFSSPGGMGDAQMASLTPLRQLATARKPPPVPDPVLDYQTILANADPVSRPIQVAQRNLYIDVNLFINRDYGTKRQGPLVLSQQPEVSLNGSLPVVGSLPQQATDTELRRFLRVPRLQIVGGVFEGWYREHRLKQDKKTLSGDRFATTVGVGTLPLLIGEHILFRPQVVTNNFRYNSPSHSEYGYTETSLTLDYILSSRTMVGGTLIRRDQYGTTPFTFDEVDTRNEGQLRGQLALARSRFTLGTMLRYDLQQDRLFDTEFAVAWRGKAIEPRMSYQTLNNQITFGFNFPGILP